MKLVRRFILIAIAILVVLAGSALLWQQQAPDSTTTTSPPSPDSAAAQTQRQISLPDTTTLYTSSRDLRRDEIEISGNSQAAEIKEYTAPTTGSIAAVYNSRDDIVQQNRLMLELDTAEIDYQIADMEYQIEQEQLSGSPRKQALLEQQLAQLTRTRSEYFMHADFRGVISELPFAAGDRIGSGEVLVRLITPDQLKASVQVDELDVPRLQVGQEAEVYFDAADDEPAYGVVQRIAPEGSVTGNGYTVVDVELLFTTLPQQILPGYSFSGVIFTSAAEAAITIDKRAVHTLNADSGLVYPVVQQDPLTVRVQPVAIASHSMLAYRIPEGIAAGTQLAAAADVQAAQQETAGGGSDLPGLRIPGSGAGARGGRPPSRP